MPHELPSAPANYIQERRGVNAIATFAVGANLIWRETPNADVGIDGQLELIDAGGLATGKLVAAQIKSGPSWFKQETPTHWKYYSATKHIQYWERFPLPVILFLHNTDTDQTFWVDARQELRACRNSASAILVPKSNILGRGSTASMFAAVGPRDTSYLVDSDEILQAMMLAKPKGTAFPISFFQLFNAGLTNIARSVYFDMGLAIEIAEINGDDLPHGIIIGSDEYDFIWQYIEFLVGQHIADVNYSDCLIDWYDRELVPRFIAPLTRRGRDLVLLVQEREEALIRSGKMPENGGAWIAQESLISLNLRTSTLQRIRRMPNFERLHIPHTPK